MKIIIMLCVLLAAVFARPEQKYTDKYDTTNLDEILGNDRLLMAYVNCGLDKARCTAEGKELKSHIKEALETHCAKCTEAQESGTRRVIKHLINNKPEYWKELSAKYDKDGKYTLRYEAELKTVKS